EVWFCKMVSVVTSYKHRAMNAILGPYWTESGRFWSSFAKVCVQLCKPMGKVTLPRFTNSGQEPIYVANDKALLPSRRVLARHQPQPGSKLPAVVEGARSADGGHQGRRTSGANPGNRQQPLTLGMRCGQSFELLLVIGELLLQGGKRV